VRENKNQLEILLICVINIDLFYSLQDGVSQPTEEDLNAFCDENGVRYSIIVFILTLYMMIPI